MTRIRPPATGSKAKAKATRRSRGGRFGARLAMHRETAFTSLQKLREHSVSSLMTVAVIGIALLLPALLMLAVNNLGQLGGELRPVAQLSVYFEDNVSDDEAIKVSDALLSDERIESVDYISRAQAADNFRRFSGLGDVLSALSDNPLPASLQLQPHSTAPGQLRALAAELEARSGVAMVQLDLEWIQRLDALLAFAQRAAIALITVLSAAVLFVIGNTIRLAIESRRAEIMVVKLVGGTDGFVARPFLYTGFWLGLGGGLFAWLMLGLMLLLLGAPLTQLLSSYDSSYTAQGFGPGLVAILLIGSAALGWLGALLSVRQHLADIEPR